MKNFTNFISINSRLLALAVLLILYIVPIKAYSAPFSSCPSEAFLVQDTVAKIYGVELATGHYQELSNSMGTSGKLNALAFNFHDKYLYAWSYQHVAPVRIDDQYQVTALPVTNLSTVNFYIGDIAINENIYYVYRRGAAYGLYAISLDPASPNYLVANRIIDGSSLYLKIYDLAFHPDNGLAYSVNNKGILYSIDVSTGVAVNMGNVGVSGTFGAVYFDVDGKLYISRNNDGNIFQVDIDSLLPTAVMFAQGPSSSNNDGARCALAAVLPVDVATIDFGDAPASYGTSAADNGARHNTAGSLLYMGASVDAEFDSHQFPLSDDAAGDLDQLNVVIDDEDGVQFVTAIEVDSAALLQLTASATGYVNAWIDFDLSGDFSDQEQIIASHYVVAGSNTISYTIPTWAEVGSTWARFRLSSTQVVTPVGGVSDGEVEDYLVDVVDPNITITYYPSADGWSTIAFEDNWPLTGDYDFTDLVINYRLTQYARNDGVIRVKIEGQIAAVGGSYHSGFAFRLPTVLRQEIEEDNIRYHINNQLRSGSPLEEGRDEAILVLADDLWQFVSAGENCIYYRTEPGCGSNIQMTFAMTVPISSPIESEDMPSFPYDPFLFATNGYDRGYVFGEGPGRPYEIHLAGQAPTEAFRTDFYNRGDDASDASQDKYFVDSNGMPWAINVPVEWQHPVEYMDIIYAYPQLPSYISSGGLTDTQWYLIENANIQNIFVD
jgi:LruC domain-containing protein